MLDPVTALGVAGNIIQFIDFGSKVVAKAREIQSSGSSVQESYVRTVSKDFSSLNTTLKSQLRPKLADASCLTQSAQELDDLVTKCDAAANDLSGYLDRIQFGHGTGRVRSLRRAFGAVWHKDDIDEMSERLEGLRGQLVLRLLVTLGTDTAVKATRQQQSIDLIDQNGKELLKVTCAGQQLLRLELESYFSILRARQEQSDNAATKRQEQLVEAVLKLCDSQLKRTHRRSHRSDESGSGSDSGSGEEDILGNKVKPLRRNKGRLSKDDSRMVKRILDCLYFRQITDRLDSVHEAHQHTCEWIFHDDPAQPWDNFVDWLRSGMGCYWITGKAGSGKSTLMKFILQDRRTSEALRVWASGTSFLIAPFFFWNLGSPLQKTKSGMLRSLLHDILQRLPTLVPVALPGLWRAATAANKEVLTEPSYSELKKGIISLSRQTYENFYILLIIDGFDEFDEDYVELAELFTSISTSTSIKMVLSSRPIPICVEASASDPSLRVQDLTRNDIRLYTNDKLCDHPRMRDLDEEEDGQATTLIEEVVAKSSGVFLWVTLVVESLLDGLRNYDRVVDLRQRLELLPSRLEDLYTHMIARMNPMYQRQGAQLLQIVHQSSLVQTERCLSLLQLVVADDEDSDMIYKLPTEGLDTTTARRLRIKCLTMEGRVRSRCCGLVEIQHYRMVSTNDEIFKAEVSFLHRTVVEFIQKKEVSERIQALTTHTPFVCNNALLRGCIATIKTAMTPEMIAVEHNVIWQTMRYCFQYCSDEEDATCQPQTRLVEELDRSMARHWLTAQKWRGKLMVYPKPIDHTKHWSSSIWSSDNGAAPSQSLLDIVSRLGLSRTAQDMQSYPIRVPTQTSEFQSSGDDLVRKRNAG